MQNYRSIVIKLGNGVGVNAFSKNALGWRLAEYETTGSLEIEKDADIGGDC